MKVIIEIEPELFNNVVKRTQEGDYMSDVWLAVGHGIPYEDSKQQVFNKLIEILNSNQFPEYVEDDLINYLRSEGCEI